jgi:hypothetical protein
MRPQKGQPAAAERLRRSYREDAGEFGLWTIFGAQNRIGASAETARWLPTMGGSAQSEPQTRTDSLPV